MKKILVIDLRAAGFSLLRKFDKFLHYQNFPTVIYTTRPRYSEKINLKNRAYIFGNFNSNKLLRFIFLIVANIHILLKNRRSSKLILLWHDLLVLDILKLLYFKDSFLVIHNVIRHGKNRPSKFDLLRWRFANKLILLSDFSKNQLIAEYPILEKKIAIIQHPSVDDLGSVSVLKSHPKDRNYFLTFIGADRVNRGLNQLKFMINSMPSYPKGDMTLSKQSYRKMLKILNSLTQNDFESAIKSNHIFVLPYIESTQSGVFYSLLGNQSLFISTNTGDTGDKMVKANLQGLFFDLEDQESLLKAIDYAEKNHKSIRNKLNKLKSLVNNNFKNDILKILG